MNAKDELLGIIARMYCDPKHSGKEVDANLSIDIADAILAAGFVRREDIDENDIASVLIRETGLDMGEADNVAKIIKDEIVKVKEGR